MMNGKKQSKSAKPWKTDHWFVSPWNFLEEVTKDFKAPKNCRSFALWEFLGKILVGPGQRHIIGTGRVTELTLVHPWQA